MKKASLTIFIFLVLSALVLTACSGGGTSTEKSNVPAPYAGKTNPLGSDAAAAGKTIYEGSCVACHGDSGKGDGPAGAALNPPAANLVDAVSKSGDDFIFYRISEGGAMEPYNSSMPAFKGSLSENEIWELVSYLHSLK